MIEFFNSNRVSRKPLTGTPPTDPIDWFAVGNAWNSGRESYLNK